VGPRRLINSDHKLAKRQLLSCISSFLSTETRSEGRQSRAKANCFEIRGFIERSADCLDGLRCGGFTLRRAARSFPPIVAFLMVLVLWVESDTSPIIGPFVN